jgi:hypothetical protein
MQFAICWSLPRAQRRQAAAHRITHCTWVDAWKAAMDNKDGPSNAPAIGGGDDGDHLF